MTRKFEAVLFDVEDILLEPPTLSDVEGHMEGIRRAYDHLAGLGADLPEFPMAFRLIFGSVQAMRLGLAFGNLREIDLEAKVTDLVGKAVPGLTEAQVRRTVDRWYEPFDAQVQARPGAGALLETLSEAGLRVQGGINTPWPRRLVASSLHRVGLDRLKGLTLSSEVGHRRPNLYFYVSALETLDAAGDRTAYVTAAAPGTLEAAEEKGLFTVRLGSLGSTAYAACIEGLSMAELPGFLTG